MFGFQPQTPALHCSDFKSLKSTNVYPCLPLSTFVYYTFRGLFRSSRISRF